MKPIEINNIREQLRSIIENDGYSISAIARSQDISASSLSLFLADKYTGNNEKIAKGLQTFINRLAEKKKRPIHENEFQLTRNSKRIMEVCRICHVEAEIGVVYGPAGLGKTITARKYAADTAGAVYVEVDPSFSAQSLIKELHKRLGGDGKGSLYDLFQDIISRLSASQRLVIVDQAEILPRKGIELLRAINDKAGVGVVLLGMDTLRNTIKGARAEFAQLYSRIGISIRLKEFEDNDVEMIVNSAIPGSNGLHKNFALKTRNGRTLQKLIKRTKLMAHNNNRQPDALVVNESFKLLEV